MRLSAKLALASTIVGSLAAGRSASAASVDATAMMALAQSSGCLACHALNHAKVAPSYDEIARRFHGQPNALQTLQNAILNGHSGTWGLVPMPSYGGAQNLLTPAQAEDLARWVLSMSPKQRTPPGG